LTPLDFEKRAWVAYSGWPIRFDELEPYYRRASQFLMVDNRNYDTDLFAYLPARPPRFDPQKLHYHFSKWSPKPSLRETYFSRLRDSEQCRVVLHANVTKIVLDDNFRNVDRVSARSLAGKSVKVRPKALILAVGGIETARLLLANNTQQKRGIGNDNDLVGRFFQDHPNALIGWVKSGTPAKVQRLFNVFHKRGLKYSVRSTAAHEWQREHNTLNATMGITFVQEGTVFEDLRDLHGALKSALRGKKTVDGILPKILGVGAHPWQAASPLWHYAVRGRSFSPGAKLQVGLTSEQEPDPESRILLSEQTDALGMRRANVRWKVGDSAGRTLRLFAQLLVEQFHAANIGAIEVDDWIRDENSNWREHICDQYHHIGTARMSDSPREGVVDRNSRVHGIGNLYIAGSAVFPTSGHSNPTLTILALCFRLLDHIVKN
jgi:choline dehydrogenase-like flavoprotein